jgi:hypothetical protein
VLIVAKAHGRQLGRHHCAVAFGKVPAVPVERSHIGRRIVADVNGKDRLGARCLTSTPAVAAVENLSGPQKRGFRSTMKIIKSDAVSVYFQVCLDEHNKIPDFSPFVIMHPRASANLQRGPTHQ